MSPTVDQDTIARTRERAFATFPRIVIAAAVLSLSVCALFNAIVDPSFMFLTRRAIVDRVVRQLAAGHNVELVYNIDDRYLQEAMVGTLTHRPDVVVTGSSRSRKLGSASFPGLFLRNSSVNNAALEDHIAVYGLYDERGLLPRTAVIEMSPWLFNPDFKEGRWMTLGRSYEHMVRQMNVPSRLNVGDVAAVELARYQQLISLSYLQDSWSALGRRGSLDSQVVVRSADDPNSLFRSDGSDRWGLYLEKRTLEDNLARVTKAGLASAFLPMRDYHRMAPERMDVFAHLLRFLNDRHVRVVLLFLPFHPAVYPDFRRTGQDGLLADVEAYARSLAGKDVIVAGSYDPADFGCEAQDFIDGIHPFEKCSSRITIPIAARLRAEAGRDAP